MPLPIDPDTLRVPAFMRKKNIRRRSLKPLILTALDRKRAGVVLEELKKKHKVVRHRKINIESQIETTQPIFETPPPVKTNARRSAANYETFAPPLFDLFTTQQEPPRAPRASKKRTPASSSSRPKKTCAKKIATPTFAEPIVGFDVPKEYSQPRKSISTIKPKKIRNTKNASPRLGVGTLTHYYDKIKVGVIKLSGKLSVGDCILYEVAGAETEEEKFYEQIVESMEIDRAPVFKAGRGKEIGLKLNKIPKPETTVFLG